jgi:anti-anti-sigma regulatory factor
MSSNEDEMDVVLSPAEGGDEAIDPSDATAHDRSSIEAERAWLMQERRNLTAQRQAADAREQALDGREAKLSEAQVRLASEWEHLHVDRAAYDALAADLGRRQEDLAARLRRLAEDTESLGRQRIELASRTGELAEFKQRLTFEWQRLAAERAMGASAGVEGSVLPPNEPVAEPEATAEFPETFAADASAGISPAECAESSAADAQARTPVDFDVLEPVRHNKVFWADRSGATLVVMPLGDASEFHYGDVHVESNKVRRLLEGGPFRDLVVDLGNAPVYSAVTINVVVALSRIASNRGGRAVLCRASEKTRTLLQTMKLLDVWPLFENREDAFQALASPRES